MWCTLAPSRALAPILTTYSTSCVDSLGRCLGSLFCNRTEPGVFSSWVSFRSVNDSNVTVLLIVYHSIKRNFFHNIWSILCTNSYGHMSLTESELCSYQEGRETDSDSGL